MQKQLDALKGDTSEEARIQAQQLQLELNEANKDLEETQYDKWMSDQESMLDKVATDTQEWIDAKLADTNGLLSEIRDAVSNSDSLEHTLQALADEWCVELSQEMLTTLSSGSKVDTSDAIDRTKSLTKIAENSVTISSNVQSILSCIQSWTTQNVSDIKTQNLKGYASGSRRIRGNQLALTQENGQELIYDKSKHGILTYLGDGDKVWTNEMSEKLWNIAQGNLPFNVVQPQINLPVMKNENNRPVNIENIGFEINLPNVQNYDQFKQQLVRDDSFEKYVKTVSLSKAFGRNSLNKLSY